MLLDYLDVEIIIIIQILETTELEMNCAIFRRSKILKIFIFCILYYNMILCSTPSPQISNDRIDENLYSC